MNIENTWNNGAGMYVIAGGDCFVSLLGNFIDKYGGDQYFNDDKIAAFIQNSVDKYLYSYGTGLSYKTKKMSPNHSEKIAREVGKISERPFMKNSKLYIDSGGFQVAMGAVETKTMPLFIDKYHQFLNENHKNFSHAFTLDLPPGPSSMVFESYQQLEDLNRRSYQESSKLPQVIKDKMLYIHHFRTPSIYNTWEKFLWDENLADGYINFATGGLVANMATDMTIPCIIYAIPLSEILRYAIDRGLKEFNFHVLGGANFIDVFYHKLFSYHILKTHGIKVNISYDSSAIFKALAIGRFIPVFKEDGTLIKMDLRSNSIHLRFQDGYTVEEMVYNIVNEIADNYGFRRLDPKTDPIYQETHGIDKLPTFSRSVHMYLICYMLRIYRYLELKSDEYVEEIYPLYQQGKQLDFDIKCYNLAKRFNQGKNTRKQKAKIASLFKSLQILTDMDREYNKHLIHKFMSNDDISVMGDDKIIKF